MANLRKLCRTVCEYLPRCTHRHGLWVDVLVDWHARTSCRCCCERSDDVGPKAIYCLLQGLLFPQLLDQLCLQADHLLAQLTVLGSSLGQLF